MSSVEFDTTMINMHERLIDRLEVWPGYITAAAEYEGGMMLMADVSHRVMRTQTVHEKNVSYCTDTSAFVLPQ